MKATGVVRRIDSAGKIEIPSSLRAELEVYIEDPVEYFTDDNCLILKRYAPEESENPLTAAFDRMWAMRTKVSSNHRLLYEAQLRALQLILKEETTNAGTEM